ncbi:MAG: biotin/lipoyl-binding protein, partial [Oscillospiraceae bacterium]|nr:biotin/lipoyl-binding protein [Oscillospiraceae bacterium]
MMKKTILLLACLVLSMTGCSEKINTAEVALLTEKEIIKQYTADGTISSESENVSVTVGFSDVRVSEVSVSIGDIVKKGDKICEFDSTGVRAEIDELTDSIDVDSKKREADLNYYKSAIEYAETSRTNVINLFT